MMTPPSDAAATMDLPIIDLDLFHKLPPNHPSVLTECTRAAQALITYGALIAHSSIVTAPTNDSFLDLMEDYFSLGPTVLIQDERPEHAYQVGVTLENTEKPKCAVHAPCLNIIAKLAPEERPLDIMGHQPDPKCRFFWRMGELPVGKTEFAGLNLPNVYPEHELVADRWEETMTNWGMLMKRSVNDVASMVATGLGLPNDVFTRRAQYGPHLLAPTASDLVKYGEMDTILAGFHTDLNFLTIHGRSRYPGLNIWARNTGKRIAVKIPPGNHLLVQAGKQIEYITGGLIKAGYHEVVVNEATLDVVEKRKETGRPLIRISSTFFYHLASDEDLTPLKECVRKAAELDGVTEESIREWFPGMKVGELVQEELRDIALMN